MSPCAWASAGPGLCCFAQKLDDVPYLDVGLFLAERLNVDKSLVLRASFKEANPPAGAGPPHTTLDSRALAERHGIVAPDAWEVLESVLGDALRPT